MGAADAVVKPEAAPLARDAGRALGATLVFLSALFWSFGGAIALFVAEAGSWTVVFWRSVWAAAFLLAFMLWRDGPGGTVALFRSMGWAGLAVGLCFATASTSFVVALAYTTVANIVLMQAGVPLIAAAIAFAVFGERVNLATAVAIVAVIAGVAVMVSDSLSGAGSLVGDGLALLIALAFSLATVLTRRFAHVRMTPATCLGVTLAGSFAATQASSLAVSAFDMAVLFAFGALNLGLGLALFASGARLVPAALAALLGTMETVLSPVWVWLVHGQEPATRTLIGGGIVFAALLVHLAFELRRQARPAKPGSGGLPTPR
ncbi:MAG TPA: DMT family transporter [Mesorhizobium sp.]|jgi:drug/metabolite transporter (DMT)-like permease|nr:DMT family transporter [Mesorhizobium sp.]